MNILKNTYHDTRLDLGGIIKDNNTFRLGNIKCSTYTIVQLLDEVKSLLNNKKLVPRTILDVNAHIYNIAYTDAVLRQTINAARIVAADGMSIVWASRLFGERIPERCNMTEAFRAFLQNESIPKNVGILVGTTEEEAKEAAINIEKVSTHCRIKNAISGYLQDSDYKQIFASLEDIDFIFIGMGTPKSQKIIKMASTLCPKAIVWHIGAGTIKIIAGKMKEAPIILRRTGLQWLHRLYCDPIVLWRRYLIGNPLFLYRIFKSRIQTLVE